MKTRAYIHRARTKIILNGGQIINTEIHHTQQPVARYQVGHGNARGERTEIRMLRAHVGRSLGGQLVELIRDVRHGGGANLSMRRKGHSEE